MFKPCIIIPIYNHGVLLQKSIKDILLHKIPVLIVDDGSNKKTKKILDEIKSANKDIYLFRLNSNKGKGKAVCHGFFKASKKGFTHAVQIDADNQHNVSDIDIFLNLAKNNPNALINGFPAYDKTVPKLRLYGRKITNFWVKVETISSDIKDAMCGFRVYPLKEVMLLLKRKSLSSRMGFDIDIIVSLYWQGVKVINQETKVTYPVDGTSHFKMLQDNVAIFRLHTKLVFGMLLRLTKLI